jgi:hypothetical protein
MFQKNGPWLLAVHRPLKGKFTMAQASTSAIHSVEAIPLPPRQPKPKQSRAAIKRCCAAWQRAYDAFMEGKQGSSVEKAYAKHKAAPAYCEAMPTLAGYESIRDFIACAAHGILIDKIPEKKATQLLYAAQVALSSLKQEPKPQRPS